MLLRGANNGRYYQFKVGLSNNTTKGIDNYPKMMGETMRMLTDYVPPPRLQRVRDPDGEGLASVQGEGGALRGPKKDIKCYYCKGPHYKSECPKLKLLDAGIQNLNVDDWCDEEHNLFSDNDGYGLVQKQAKGV